MKSFYSICLSLFFTITMAQQSPNNPNQTQLNTQNKGCVSGDRNNG